MSKQKTPFNQVTALNDLGLGSDGQLIANESNGIAIKYKFEKSKISIKTITSAQLKALFTTPITVIDGVDGYIAQIHRMVVRHEGGIAYSGIAAGEDLVLKYGDASGVEITAQMETTGFLDQTTPQIRTVGGLNVSLTPVAGADVVLHLLSDNITTGDFDLEVFVEYDLIPSDFSGADF